MKNSTIIIVLIAFFGINCLSSTILDESVFEISVEWQKYLKQNKEIGPEENFLSSPLGLTVLLGQIRVFANLQLKDAINILLNWSKGNRVHLEFSEELDKLKLRQDEVFKLKCQNAIFLPDSVNVSDIAEELLKDHYHSDVVKLDWSQQAVAQQTINDWVKRSTENLIPELNLQPNAKFVIVNTIFFEAEWLDQLDPRTTVRAPFKVTSEKTVDVDYLRFSEDLHWAEDTYYLKSKVIAKPYKTAKTGDDTRMNMYIILPDEGNDIENVISLISNLNFNQMLQSGGVKKVTYQIPKVNLKSKFKFKPFLTKFYGQNLSYEVQGLTLGNESLNIDDISQETVLEVDEKGTRAASVSSATIDYSFSDKTFKVDRPFIMLIREENTKFILFWATVRNPTLN